ncbi:MAG: hypothetical protein HOP15_18215, partial [Planctomycetes bacterium]|nr:hypothetical protein [Planctomycetota bacterium]
MILGFVGGVALIGFVLLARARPTLPVAEAAPAEIAPLVEDSSSERVREERPQSHEDTPSEARERVDRGPIQI